MKRALGLFVGALLAFSLAGCDDGGTSGTGGTGGGTGGTGGGTGGTGGGTGGTGGGTGGTGGMMSNLSCAAYCAAIQANCKNDAMNHAQYGDEASCMAICATFPIGTEGAMDGNSLGCRTYHGGDPAAGMPGTHCPHAGPLGGGVCGSDECDNFCGIAVAICGEQAAPPYASKDECMTACGNFMGTGAVPYNTTVVDGDSLACRMYHLTVASTSQANKDLHCPHVAAVSDTCQ